MSDIFITWTTGHIASFIGGTYDQQMAVKFSSARAVQNIKDCSSLYALSLCQNWHGKRNIGEDEIVENNFSCDIDCTDVSLGRHVNNLSYDTSDGHRAIICAVI